jgi:hypothetical protein
MPILCQNSIVITRQCKEKHQNTMDEPLTCPEYEVWDSEDRFLLAYIVDFWKFIS